MGRLKIAQKIFKSKIEACPVNAGHYMALKHSISFATNLAANFGCYRFRITPDIVSKLLRAARAIWSRCAVRFRIWADALSSDSSSIQTCCFAQESNLGLEGEFNDQALGAALRLCLRGSDRPAQTQGVSESAAVAAGCNRLVWRKHATTLAILTQFKIQQGFNAL